LRRASHLRHQAIPLRSSPSSRRGSIAATARQAFSSPTTTGRPRRHDGAPLRQDRTRSGGRPRPLVVPVVTTGLHCGSIWVSASDCQSSQSSPSSRRGSIAATTSATPYRNPLRVVPVVTTGLHCGDVRRRDGCRTGGGSSPSSRRGLRRRYIRVCLRLPTHCGGRARVLCLLRASRASSVSGCPVVAWDGC